MVSPKICIQMRNTKKKNQKKTTNQQNKQTLFSKKPNLCFFMCLPKPELLYPIIWITISLTPVLQLLP